MEWFGEALAALGFMGLANLGETEPLAVGSLHTVIALVSSLAILPFFRERHQSTRVARLETTPPEPWLMAR
jgi:hypothetical protein